MTWTRSRWRSACCGAAPAPPSRPPNLAASAPPSSHDLAPRAPQWPAGTPWRHSHAKIVPPRPHLHALVVTDRRSHQRPLGGGGLAHLGQHNTTTTPPTQEKLVTTPSKTPKTTPQGTPNFDFALLGPETTPGGKFCFLFCFVFLCFLLFLWKSPDSPIAMFFRGFLSSEHGKILAKCCVRSKARGRVLTQGRCK